jgi:hypothetical protein
MTSKPALQKILQGTSLTVKEDRESEKIGHRKEYFS